MKILLTVHQFFPDFFAGTEVLTLSVAKELLRRGHQVIVFTGHPVKQPLPEWQRFDCYDLDGVTVYRFHHTFVPMGEQEVVSEIEYDNHLAARFFAHLLVTVRPDIVHFFHFSRLGASLVDVARHESVPACYTPTDFWALCPTTQLLLGNGSVCPGPSTHGGNCIKHVATLTHWRHIAALVRHLPDRAVDAFVTLACSNFRCSFPFRQEIVALSRRSEFIRSRVNGLHAIVSPTQLMTDMLVRNGVDPRLIVQSAYGLDISGFDGEQRTFDSTRPLTFGYIGTLIPHKGCEVLIKAFLRLDHKNVRLNVYGDLGQFPDYVSRLRALAASHEEIAFLGTFPNSRIAEVLANIDALVVPSLWYENTPLVVYSALAAKCPVVASDFPGMSEVVRDGYNGLTFEPGNVRALTRCLDRMIRTPDLLRELSERCQKPKSIATYVDELLSIYTRMDHQPLHDLPSLRSFDAYQPRKSCGRLAGWAAFDFTEPLSLRLLTADREIARATQLQPRPDVRPYLARSGHAVEGVNFGFVLMPDEPVAPDELVLVVESRSGDLCRIPLSTLTVGQPFMAGHTVVVGIDEATFAPLPPTATPRSANADTIV